MSAGQLALGYVDRHEGQAAALAAATAPQRGDYRQRCEAALAALVRAGGEFTADDVRRLAGPQDGAGRNVLPSVIGVAAHPDTGIIVPAGEYRSRRRERRGSRNRVWIARPKGGAA
ncbi:hypothetical protein MOQ72_29010 [Saccharopolyspora sp. K220]|uniref:hypothetical protein n=1 Tax=Saccharopolyspora soli TaxID=2926618 RepID=UPI001F565403|nr:hypothetical protein [Saccharopolyspora soli]MCI2421481.1 hypothetical protein [Saccharopolyspora soli]